MERRESIITGLMGAMLGAMLCAIPWMLAYWFGFVFAILALPIAFGAFKGYVLFHGKKIKGLPAILAMICWLTVSICIFLIIPVLTLIQEGLPVSFEMIDWYFSSSELLEATLKDFAYTLLFSLFGMFPFAQHLSMKSNFIKEKRNDVAINQSTRSCSISMKKKAEGIKNMFMEQKACSKNSVISKEEIKQNLDPEYRFLFQQFVKQKIIRKKKKGYYFDEKSEVSYWRRVVLIFFSALARTLFVFLLLFILLMCLV